MSKNDRTEAAPPRAKCQVQAFIILRRIAYGPFSDAKRALDWADKQWPGEEHDLQGLHDPDDL